MNEYEAEVIVGIEDIVIAELKNLNHIETELIRMIRPGFIRFFCTGTAYDLLKLRSVIAVYAVHHFDIPRPKALLGHQNFTYLSELLSQQINQWHNPTETFGIGAAGSNSSVFQRVKQQIAQTLGLQVADDGKGELFLRCMPAIEKSGWEILIRMSQHPLSARKWRIQNIPGALNATVAYAMKHLAQPEPDHHILNLCSGTATILIEHSETSFINPIFAIDNDHLVLSLAQQNIEASKNNNTISQIHGDAQQTPFKNNQFDTIYADLPFGHHVGSHEENEWLYPAILSESERIAKRTAKFLVITHEISLFEQCVALTSWKIKHSRQITLSGLHPRIFVLERN